MGRCDPLPEGGTSRPKPANEEEVVDTANHQLKLVANNPQSEIRNSAPTPPNSRSNSRISASTSSCEPTCSCHLGPQERDELPVRLLQSVTHLVARQAQVLGQLVLRWSPPAGGRKMKGGENPLPIGAVVLLAPGLEAVAARWQPRPPPSAS